MINEIEQRWNTMEEDLKYLQAENDELRASLHRNSALAVELSGKLLEKEEYIASSIRRKVDEPLYDYMSYIWLSLGFVIGMFGGLMHVYIK
jgi:hypothetical protein